MATSKKPTAKITLRTVLEHVQALSQETTKRFISLETKMKSEFKAVHEKIDGVERRLTRQIDGVDQRLDDMEVNVIPALKKAVGAR